MPEDKNELVSVGADGSTGKEGKDFVIEELDGTVKRERLQYKNGEVVAKVVEEPAGYMVYFPNGNSIRVRDHKELCRLGFRAPTAPAKKADGTDAPAEGTKKAISAREKSRGEINEVKSKFKEI